MDHEKSILNEIVNNLDDDTPRLILADWYSERDDPRGDFIRTQCELASMDWDDPRYEVLETLEESLLEEHRAKWLKGLPKLDGVAWGSLDLATSRTLWWAGRTYFRRGFAELVTYKDYASYHKNARAIAEYGFVTHSQFLNMNAKAVEQLVGDPLLRGSSHRLWTVDTGAIRRFAAREHLQLLSLHECSLDHSGLLDLMDVKFPSLEVLDLAFNQLNLSMLDLIQWEAFAQLRWLRLSGNGIGVHSLGGAARDSNDLQKAPTVTNHPFRNLHVLSLQWCHLTTNHVSNLCASVLMKRLTELDLSDNNLRDDSVTILTKADFPTLRHVDLGANELTDAAAITLSEAPFSQSLRRLDLGDNSIGDDGIDAIAQSPYLSNLTHLNIPRLNVGVGAVEALIRSTTLNSIRFLNIGDIELDAKTLKDLQRRYPKAIVREPYR